jgi:hypothetical protein
MTVATLKGQTTELLPALTTTGTGVAVSVPISSKCPRFHVRGAGTISGGTIIIEEALSPDYTGTWSQIQSIAASGLTGGAEQVIHLIDSTISAVRARISSNITGGGSVSVDLVSD